jgi:hypothetical protein
VQVAHDRAQRIRDLLANCSGAASSSAATAASEVQQAQKNLGDIVVGISPNTPANRTQRVEEMLAAQASAYDAAVACGLVTPNVPNPGGWDATWWNISSP